MLTRVIDGPGFNAVVLGKHGHVVYNKNDLFVGRAIEKYGEFSELEVALFAQLVQPGDVVVECGANIGAHTLVLAKLCGPTGRVHALEPQRIVFQTLCATLAINSIENVECHQVAASSEDGVLLLPDFRYDRTANFGGVAVDGWESGHRVRTVALDTFLDLPRLKLLKIDVEGMEERVITGARRLIERLRPVLYVENDRVERSRPLIELIRSLGYRLFWHLPPLYNPGNHAGDAENLFPNVVSINMIGFHRSVRLDLTGFQEVGGADEHPLKEVSS